MEFRQALKQFQKKFSSAIVTLDGIWANVFGQITRKQVNKSQASEIRRLNLSFLEEFEKLVEIFVKKYGVKVRL